MVVFSRDPEIRGDVLDAIDYLVKALKTERELLVTEHMGDFVAMEHRYVRLIYHLVLLYCDAECAYTCMRGPDDKSVDEC